MGITGLLPFLEKATRTCSVSEFRGGTVTVDSYCLLHKGANACAEQLSRGEDNQMYVQYCLKYVKMLQSYNIHPIMVFDGRNLPAKAETEAKRRESRKRARQRAAELLSLGKTEEARSYLKQCVDITPKMAHNLIKECRKLNVDCIVAPYESDAQMAYFNMKGVAECVITEDSDLVLFGCKKVLYKLDLNGIGRLVEADKIYLTMKMRPDQFTFEKFRFMCILSGCDYVSSLNGIGLKKAEKFLALTAETNPEVFLDRIPRYLNMKHLVITEDYKKSVLIANATFLHQVVFDPYKKKLVHLTDPEVAGTNPDFLINAGDKFDHDKAYQVALGNLDPYSFQSYDDWSPSDVLPHSIWSGVYKKRISRKQENEIQKFHLKKYLSIGTTSTPSQSELLLEEERQIEQDLSVYTKRLQVKVAEETDNQVDHLVLKEDHQPKAETSPIIPRNPFLKKKKLSKFPLTYTCGNTIVKSRYFSPETTNKNEQSVDHSAAADIKEIENAISNTMEEEVKCSEDILETRVLTCNTTMTKKRVLEEVTLREDIKQEVSEERKIDHAQKNGTQNDQKRRKLGPCRTVGLNKSKKTNNQQTLHSFFTTLKRT